MTKRLPIPGQDDGTWGDILNGFLEVSLNADGTIATSALNQAGGITTSGGLAVIGTPSSSNYLRGDGTWAIPNSGSSSLASDSDVLITSPASNQVLTYNSGAGKWENEAAVNSLTVNGGSAQTGAVSISAVQVAGDIGGTAANPTLSGTSNVESIISANTTVTGALQKTNNLSDVSNTTTARGNITAAKSGANSDITSLTGLTTPLAVNEGGTGSATQNFVDLSSTQSSIGGAKTFTSNLTAPAHVASGLTGASAASRYVGATTSGAPTGSNPFVVGDFVIDQTAKIWVCTVAGSPGTWAAISGTAFVLSTNSPITGNYTLQLTDAGCMLYSTSSSAVTVTVPHGLFPNGEETIIQIRQTGTGQVTVASDGTSTISDSNAAITRTQYSLISVSINGNTAYIDGDT